MRIAYVCDSSPLVSQTFVTNEIAELTRRGFEILPTAIVEPRESVTSPELQALRARTFYFYRSNAVRALHALLWLVRAPRRFIGTLLRMRRAGLLGPFSRALPLASHLAGKDVDLIHAHFAGAATECAMAAAGLLGVPYSFTAHAHDIFVAPRALRDKFAGAALTVTVCEYNRRFLRDELGFDPATIPIIVCCVDPERFARKTPYAKGAPPLVVSIGRLVEKKGFDVLIDAVARLRKRGIDCDVEIIGTGPLEGALKEQAKRAGVDDRVRFTGALPHAEVYAHLERAAIYAQPFCVAADGDRDSMPVVVKEAMAMEIPIVSTREVAVPEMVLEGCGELVPPRDAAAFEGALGRMLARSDEELRAIGRRGREVVIERFDIRREVAKLGRLFLAAGLRRPGRREPNVDESF